ncbi:MAG TPA: zinc-binding alcohol dehydrogenase family protein [Streptosporangiaceae bacterium]|nr:zinc-binding alcohol dehydrogenase family protein [Streptosporangiaceae bacterium]
MHAAVVTTFGAAPRYQEFPVPVPADDDQMLVDVLAAGLHPRVRSQANGSHYTSTGELPLVPGVDGVGRGPDGLLRYFILPDTAMGAMAEQTVIDVRRSVVLDDSVDPVAVAAAMNPAMSSWVALRQRIAFQPGQDVLVLGATGNSGQLAVQIAKRSGARNVIAAGRNPARLATLPALGATATVSLDSVSLDSGGQLAKVAADVDVVLDYVWGEPTAAAMAAIITSRADRSKPLTWIQIGSVAGRTSPIPSAALRAARLQIVGSGQGSVSPREYLAELPALAELISAGTLDIAARAMPLADVEQAWATDAGQRIVLVTAAR